MTIRTSAGIKRALLVLVTLCAIVWLAAGSWERIVRSWRPGSRPELRALVEAVGAQRLTRGRLTGGFAWGELPPATRGAARGAMPRGRATPDVQLAAARLAQRAARDRTALTLAAAATADLALGQIAPAVERLEEAVALDPTVASVWSDLSAAYLERAGDTQSPADVARALDAAERAVSMNGRLPEAQFNRALALEWFGLTRRAADVWRAYLAIDTTSLWAAEARLVLADVEVHDRRSRGPDVQDLRDHVLDEVLPRWAVLEQARDPRARDAIAEAEGIADGIVVAEGKTSTDRFIVEVVARARHTSPETPSLLAGHIAYGKASSLYKRDQNDAAAAAFDDAVALLARAHSPLALSARMYRALVAYRQRDGAGAEQQLSALLPLATQASYESLVGRIMWTLGVLAVQQGAYAKASADYQRALEAFARIDDASNGAFVQMLVADAYERRGDPERGWPDLRLALAGGRREAALLQAAQSATHLNWVHVAATLQDEAVRLARDLKRETNEVDALRWRALTASSLGRSADAVRLLGEARAIAAEQHDSTWDRLRAELDLAEASIAPAANAASGIAAAARAAAYFEAANAPARLEQVLVASARLRRLTGDVEAARGDLARAVALLIEYRDLLPTGSERLAFAETAHRVGEALVSLEFADRRPERALVEADRLRSWDLAEVPSVDAAIDLSRVRHELGADTAVLYYSIGETESFVWLIRRDGVQAWRLAANRSDLQRLLSALRPEALESPIMNRLSALVLAPIAGALGAGDRLVVVPDGPLHALPFAALPGRRSRFFVEEHVLSQSPSLAALFAPARVADAGGSRRRVLAVGNPRIDPMIFPDLAPLPNAVIEARQIAGMYPASDLLEADAATVEAVLAAMRNADVFHFGGHAVINDLHPEESQLGLMNRHGQPLTAIAISRLTGLHLRLVMLAACQSLGGPSVKSQGRMGLARAFLEAGVPTVVANRWLVDDRASVTLSTRFHREYLQSGDAAASLRAGQLAMIGASDPRLRAPSAWAGWTLVDRTLR